MINKPKNNTNLKTANTNGLNYIMVGKRLKLAPGKPSNRISNKKRLVDS